MNCREFENEWVALDDNAQMPAELQQHRAECGHCAGLSDDLNAIAAQARAMREAVEPPQRVWAALRNQMETEGLIRETSREPVLQEAKPRRATAAGWFYRLPMVRLPMGMAYAAVFFVAVGVMYMFNQNTASGPPPLAGTPQVPAIAWISPDTAEQDKNVVELMARMPEERRETFVSNWNQVNSSIESLSDFVVQHPEDPFAAEMLRNSLQQKEHLRGTSVRWEGF